MGQLNKWFVEIQYSVLITNSCALVWSWDLIVLNAISFAWFIFV